MAGFHLPIAGWFYVLTDKMQRTALCGRLACIKLAIWGACGIPQ
jgi:hypothetical protein